MSVSPCEVAFFFQRLIFNLSYITLTWELRPTAWLERLQGSRVKLRLNRLNQDECHSPLHTVDPAHGHTPVNPAHRNAARNPLFHHRHAQLP